MIKKIYKVLKNPKLIPLKIISTSVFKNLSDEKYIRLMYYLKMDEKLDLKNPETYNQKLQWLKLYDRNPLYTRLVDKYEVREYIKQSIGEEYLIPLINLYDDVENIKFEELPDQFVLKCTHDSGSVIVCTNKNKLDKKYTKEKLKIALNKNYYYKFREWPYKNVKPRIVCEKMLEDKIIDYKIFCFNGKPKFLYVGQGLVSDHSLKIDFYDLNWNKMELNRTDYENFDKALKKPTNLNEMINIAEKLSSGIPFVRVDLYEIGDKIYFSEFTFTPGAGYIPFEPKSYDRIIGDLLKLPNAVQDKNNIKMCNI